MHRIEIAMPDGVLSVLRFGDEAVPPKLIFCHANGFNAQSYRAVIAPLNVPALALDLRGHGQSDLPIHSPRLQNWHVFADDIARLFDAAVSEPVVLAGHSFGAVSALLALSQIRDKVGGYVGLDPVIMPLFVRQFARLRAGRAMMKRHIPIASKAGQRRSVFENAGAAYDRYQSKGAFIGIADAVLRDYLDGGLMPTDDGQVRLACDPEWEQAIYVAQSHNVFRQIGKLPGNSRIVFAGAKGRVSTGSLRRKLQRLNPDVSIEYEAAREHLFPLQDPDYAADLLRSVIDRL